MKSTESHKVAHRCMKVQPKIYAQVISGLLAGVSFNYKIHEKYLDHVKDFQN